MDESAEANTEEAKQVNEKVNLLNRKMQLEKELAAIKEQEEHEAFINEMPKRVQYLEDKIILLERSIKDMSEAVEQLQVLELARQKKK